MHPHIRPHRRAPVATPAPVPQVLDPEKTATFAGGGGVNSDSLAFDPAHTGTNSAIAVQTITVTESKSSTSPTAPSPTQSSTRPQGSGHSKLGTGAVVGIAVGIFAILAITMVMIMTIKHKKKTASQRERQRNAARAAAEAESKGTAMRMTEKLSRSPGAPGAATSYTTPKASAALAAVVPPPPPVFRGQTTSVVDDDSFLSLKSTHSLQRLPPSAPQSNNPFLPYLPSQRQQEQQSHAQTATHAGSSSSSSSNGIPNPFSSPSPSRSPSNATTTSVATHHAPTSSAASIDPTMLASFPAIQYANAHFSISDYTDPDPSSPPATLNSPYYLQPPHTASTIGHLNNFTTPRTPVDLIVPPTPPIQALSNKPLAREAKAREMRGLADLITALDSAPSTPPSSWISPNDGQGKGSSRLSRGEGLVAVDETHEGIPVDTAYTSPTPAGPLPPSHLFRAALAPDSTTDIKGKVKGKAKGKAKEVGNPFEG